MDAPIYDCGMEIGRLTAVSDGLYWQLTAFCRTDRREVLRLYGVTGLRSEAFGVLLPEGVGLQLHRRLSKHACPVLPEQWTVGREAEGFRPWRGRIEDQEIPDALLRQEAEGHTLALPADREPLPLAEYAPHMEPITLDGREYLTLVLRNGLPLAADPEGDFAT